MKSHAKILCSDAATQFSNCTDNAIRLMGGNSSNQGRLEVCVNNAWGSVCDSTGVFTSDEAKVVCRQLGILQVEGRDNPQSQFQFTAELNIEEKTLFSIFLLCYTTTIPYVLTDGVEVVEASHFGGESIGPLFLDQLHCTGDEESLSECDMFTEPGMHMCGHQHDVGVICQCKMW